MPTLARPAVFNETRAGTRRLVLILYAIVGPVFSVVLFALGGGLVHARALAAVVALITAGGVWMLARPEPAVHDWIFPVAISPTVCCGIAYASCGAHGGAYLGVLGAPLAWSAVLFEAPVAIAAWLTAVSACFAVLSLEAGPATAALNTLVLGTIYALVAWVVNGMARQLRRTRAELQSKNERDAAILEAIPDALAVVDLEGRFVDLHAPLGDALPAQPEELLGRPAFDWMEAEAARRMREALARASATGVVQVVEYSASYGGSERWFESRIARAGDARAVVIRRDLTARRATEQALQQSEARLAFALQGSGAGTFDWDLRARTVTRDAGFAAVMGHDQAEIEATPEAWEAMIHPEDRPRVLERRDAHLRGESEHFDAEYRARTSDGGWRWIRSRGRIVERDAQGRPARLIGTVTNVDAQHHAHERSLDEARLRGLENRINEIELVMHEDGALVEVNDKALAAYGRDRESLCRANVRELRAPETRASVDAGLQQVVTEQGIHFETEHLRSDGTRFPVSVSSRLFRVGEQAYVHSLVRDLTEERRAHAERNLFAGILRNMTDAVLVTDARFRITAVNAAAEAAYGVRAADVLGRELFAVLDREFPNGDGEEHRRRVRAGERSRVLVRTPAHGGARIDLDLVVDTLLDEAGNVVGRFSVGRDLSAQVAAEAQLRAKQAALEEVSQELRDVTNSVPVAVFRHRLENGLPKLMFVSDQVERLWGVRAADVMEDPMRLFERLHPDDRARFLEADRAAIAAKRALAEDVRAVLADGRVRWLHVQATPRTCDDGETLYYGTIEDVSHRKEAEERLRAAVRERETLIKEVHHRVKNNLQMMVSLFALQSDHVTEPRALAALADSQQRLRSMALIHEQLYQAPDLARVDFATFLQTLVSELRSVFGPAPAVDVALDVGEARLGVDTAIPCALIVNELVSNALKYAYPDGRAGRVCVALERDEGAADRAASFTLSVTDDGVGLPAGLDPANTGTLGLQLVHILARQLRASLLASSGPGARFQLTFGGASERPS